MDTAARKHPELRLSARTFELAGALLAVLASALVIGFAGRTVAREEPVPPPALPRLLSETGLYAGGDTSAIDPRNLPYSPQYALWSDGAAKRRWVRIPEGERIDASDPDRWTFPPGSRFWKEFSFGRRVETRFIERLADGTFRYATYVWRPDGTDAELAPEQGSKGVAEVAPGIRHDAPSRADCRACHEGRPGRVLGFGALALSPERDSMAPRTERVEGALDLAELARRGLLEGFSEELLARPPRIEASSAEERAALGYLFANCAGCHNGDGPVASVGLDFDVLVSEGGRSRARSTAFGRPSRIKLPGHERALRIAPGRPDESSVLVRMRSRDAVAQMPPLATRIPDAHGIDLVERFIARLGNP